MAEFDKHQGLEAIPEGLQEAGGILPGIAAKVAQETGNAEAHVYGVGSFYHLLSRPNAKVRVCTGLSCLMAGADKVLAATQAAGWPSEGCSCLAGCDVAPAVLKDRRVLPKVQVEDIERAGADWTAFEAAADTSEDAWLGDFGPTESMPDKLAMNLAGAQDYSGAAFAHAREMGAEAIVAQLKESGLQGRGGAGFPAHFKWSSLRSQAETKRHVVLNADEGEPGTFKDREVMMRRPDLVLEGLAIAAQAVEATDVWLYLRGEFELPKRAMRDALARFQEQDLFAGIEFHFHDGQGAYICGEETALIEALEGKRGMPRLKPPFPTEAGLWGKPTLIHNVETIACVPAILMRGGEWFHKLGRTEAGSKLYCISGDVVRPGTYELPLGINLDELVEVAGGYVGELKAFSPGGASSGFLPASERQRPLSYKALGEVGSMLGSAGVVVLNEKTDIRWAVMQQLRFFRDESCGQCAPCRIGTEYLHESVKRDGSVNDLTHVADAAWQMNEGSICGLGQAAPLPLTSALKYFPEEFEAPETNA
ncbi:MAG: NADH:ubiquinone oxidoreductase subunit F (NADH-binding)/NADH:ubiquinone oxidoreductase subunit E [Planctomycetota bacterium]|jgi:NADH:ubiquinone oxidoreductase subunit F (NADH-binding)/NADH:ubiquinone oxidoreductase subunit E